LGKSYAYARPVAVGSNPALILPQFLLLLKTLA
jgi:hypothetical protein